MVRGPWGGSHAVEQEGLKALMYLDAQECSRGACPAREALAEPEGLHDMMVSAQSPGERVAG